MKNYCIVSHYLLLLLLGHAPKQLHREREYLYPHFQFFDDEQITYPS